MEQAMLIFEICSICYFLLFLLDVAIIFVVMVTVGLSYYCYKLKTENRIEPSEEVR